MSFLDGIVNIGKNLIGGGKSNPVIDFGLRLGKEDLLILDKPEKIIDTSFHNPFTSLWLINELDTRDIEVDASPSTTVLSVVTVSDIGAPIAGNIAFSSGESKFKGYDGTNWQDLH